MSLPILNPKTPKPPKPKTPDPKPQTLNPKNKEFQMDSKPFAHLAQKWPSMLALPDPSFSFISVHLRSFSFICVHFRSVLFIIVLQHCPSALFFIIVLQHCPSALSYSPLGCVHLFGVFTRSVCSPVRCVHPFGSLPFTSVYFRSFSFIFVFSVGLKRCFIMFWETCVGGTSSKT